MNKLKRTHEIMKHLLKEDYNYEYEYDYYHSDDDYGPDTRYDHLELNPNDRIHMTKEDTIKPFSIKQTELEDKPVGLWYAFGKGWIDWAKWEMPHMIHNHLFKIEVNPAKVLTLKNDAEVIAFTKQYGIDYDDTRTSFQSRGINWSEVAKNYSGFELAYYNEDFSGVIGWKASYNIASGCIWDSSAITNITKIN
jgi:hypothetical protein